MHPAHYTRNQRQRTYKQLMQHFEASQQQDTETRWAWLMAAHIVGQHDFSLHWHNHVSMLRFGLKTRNYPEAAGQIFRLMLVPLGHALQRLPVGNIGRATVSAFEPMALNEPLKQLILKAQSATVSKTAFE